MILKLCSSGILVTFPWLKLNNGVFPNTYRIRIQYTGFCQFQVFTQKVFKTLAPATVLSASAVDEKIIEQVSKYYSKKSKPLVSSKRLVQQFFLFPCPFCSQGFYMAYLMQIDLHWMERHRTTSPQLPSKHTTYKETSSHTLLRDRNICHL